MEQLLAKNLFSFMPFLWWFEEVSAFREDFKRDLTEILNNSDIPKELHGSTMFALLSYRFKMVEGKRYSIKMNIIDLYHTLVTTAGKHVQNAEQFKADYDAEKYVLETYLSNMLKTWNELEEKHLTTLPPKET